MATTKRTAGSRADEAKRFRDLALEGPEVSVWTTDLRSGEIRLSAGWAVLLQMFRQKAYAIPN